MSLTVTPTAEMKTLAVGDEIYEVVDDEARTDITEIKADLTAVSGCERIPVTYTGKYIVTDGSTVNINNLVNSASWNCSVISCTAGDAFTINAVGGSAPRAWCFIDASSNVISKSLSSATVSNEILVAPENAAYLIINTNGTTPSYKGKTSYEHFKSVDDELTLVDGRIDTLEGLTKTREEYTAVSLNDITITDKYYVAGDNVEYGPYNQWQYGTYTIPSDTVGVRVTASAGQNACLWILKDANDNILGYSSYTGTPTVRTEDINLASYPTATTLIVNDKKSGSLAISQIDYVTVTDGEKVYVGGASLPTILSDHSADKLYGKVLCCCGDSITYGADMDADGISDTSDITVYQSNGSGVFSEVTSSFRKTWGYQIAERHSMTFYNGGVSGSTVEAVDGHSGFSATDGRYTKLPDSIDYLILWFGWNDNAYGTLGTIDDTTNESYYGGFNVVLPYLIDKYPYTKIALIVPYGTTTEHREAVRLLGAKWGVAVWDNYQAGTPLYYGKEDSVGVDADIVTANRTKYQALGAHPNYKGHKQLADMVEQFLLGI